MFYCYKDEVWHNPEDDIFSGELIKKEREFSTHVRQSIGEAVTVNNTVYPLAKTKNVKGLRLKELDSSYSSVSRA